MPSEDPIIEQAQAETAPTDPYRMNPFVHDTSPTIAKIIPALIAFQAALPEVLRTATNPHLKNKYAPYDDIREALQPILAAHGLAWMPWPVSGAPDRVTVRNMILHDSGEWMAGTFDAPFMPSTNPSQAYVGGLTYAVRAAARPLGVRTGDDTDGEVAGAVSDKAAPTRTPEQAGAKAATPPAQTDAAREDAMQAFWKAWAKSGLPSWKTDKDAARAACDDVIERVLGERKYLSKLSVAELLRVNAALAPPTLDIEPPDPTDPFADV